MEPSLTTINPRSSTNINRLYNELLENNPKSVVDAEVASQIQEFKNIKANEQDWARWCADVKTKEYLSIIESQRNLSLFAAMIQKDPEGVKESLCSARILTNVLNSVVVNGKYNG